MKAAVEWKPATTAYQAGELSADPMHVLVAYGNTLAHPWNAGVTKSSACLLYTSPSPRDSTSS
eukprot:10314363-Prorocentrum_lima.AAC.1